jgi:hypothetical protein
MSDLPSNFSTYSRMISSGAMHLQIWVHREKISFELFVSSTAINIFSITFTRYRLTRIRIMLFDDPRVLTFTALEEHHNHPHLGVERHNRPYLGVEHHSPLMEAVEEEHHNRQHLAVEHRSLLLLEAEHHSHPL